MRLSHRVAVLLDGAIAQMGCPAEVYARPTSLAVARLLGPASEIRGEASDGVLRVAQLPVLRGLPSYFRGPHRWIVRPEQVAFEPGDGPLSVAACQFAGASWHLHVTHPTAGTFVVAGRCALPVGTTGMLAWTSSDWAVPTADDASGRVSPPRA
jgi:ABC-type sulfate/molybdate transport systems ATPase subunit